MTDKKAVKETFASHCKAEGLTVKDGCLVFDADKTEYTALYRARELHREAKGYEGDLPWRSKQDIAAKEAARKAAEEAKQADGKTNG